MSYWKEWWKEKALQKETVVKTINLQKEFEGFFWKIIDYEVKQTFGSFTGLNVIHLGSGRGVISLLMGLKGANVTNVDYSIHALDISKVVFDRYGVKANFIKADVRCLPENLMGSYDISISIGLAEHFDSDNRTRVLENHIAVLGDKGRTFIAVPNKFCLPYQIYMKLSKLFRFWKIGFEKPFSRRELESLANRVGFSCLKTRGSQLFNDTIWFLVGKSTKLLFEILDKDKTRVDTWLSAIPAVKSPLDNFLGYNVLLIGTKNDPRIL